MHNLLTNITQDAFTRYVDLLPLGFLTSNGQMEIIYLQHNLLTNITQDAFTRYVDLLPLDLPEAS
jgi:hypothetical protein